MTSAIKGWQTLKCLRSEVRLEITLKCGQSFRWNHDQDTEEWIGVFRGKLWRLKQNDTEILFQTLPEGTKDTEADREVLRDYFQLQQVSLPPLYSAWSEHDPVFEKISQRFSGVRMLRQDPVENLFSFICSSNNNISRISGMVENLCRHWGTKVCDFPLNNTKTAFHSFPTIDALAANPAALEAKLRTLGFGYRAGYIAKSAKLIRDKGGEDYLLGLRQAGYEEARTELLKLTGIGPKVADCILLMSLDQPSAVPVDTHMFQIAASKYLPHLKGYKSVTDKVYKEIGDHFRMLYGDYAGWAHSVLFSADLKHLQDIDEEDSKGDVKKELLSATAKRSKQSKSTSNLGDASQTKASALAKKKKAKSTSKLSDLKASEAIKLEPVEIKSEPIEIKAEPIEIQTEHPLNDEARSRPKRQSRNLRTVNDGTTEEAKKSKQKRKT